MGGLRPKWHQRAYERVGILPAKEVLSQLVRGPKEREYFGRKVNGNSQRYIIFNKNRVCVVCGLVGILMAAERYWDNDTDSVHFNLYAIDVQTGFEVMMTKDHIMPRSKGGRDYIKNYQTMCKRCNEKKGARIET